MIPNPTLLAEDAAAWRPTLTGYTDIDILQFYHAVAPTLRQGCVCVEVGVAYGRSLLFLAEKLAAVPNPSAELYGVDPYRGRLPGDGSGDSPCSFRDALAAILREAPEHAVELIRLLRIPSIKAALCFAEVDVDLVFLDGDHSFPAVMRDLAAWWPLVSMGGILAGHDFRPPFEGVMRAVAETFGGRMVRFSSVWAVQRE